MLYAVCDCQTLVREPGRTALSTQSPIPSTLPFFSLHVWHRLHTVDPPPLRSLQLLPLLPFLSARMQWRRLARLYLSSTRTRVYNPCSGQIRPCFPLVSVPLASRSASSSPWSTNSPCLVRVRLTTWAALPRANPISCTIDRTYVPDETVILTLNVAGRIPRSDVSGTSSACKSGIKGGGEPGALFWVWETSSVNRLKTAFSSSDRRVAGHTY